MADVPPLHLLVVVATTYLLHSTLLLGGLWVWMKVIGLQSASARERLWRWATVGSLITVLCQLTLLPPSETRTLFEPLVTWRLGPESASPYDPSTLPVTLAKPSRAAPAQLPIAGAPTPIAGQQSPTIADGAVPSSPPDFVDHPVASPTSDRVLLPEPTLSPSSVSPDNITRDEPAAVDVADQSTIDVKQPDDWKIAIIPLPDSESLDPFAAPGGEPVAASRIDVPTKLTPLQSATPADSTLHLNSTHAETAVAMGESVPSPSTALPRQQTWIHGIELCLLLTLSIGCVRLCWELFLVHRLLLRATPVTDGPGRSTLDRLCERNAVGCQVMLANSSECGEPAACGLWNPVILLPFGLEERLSKAELKGLLAHELAHVIRRDPWWLWIGRLLTLCAPFQPLNFLGVREWQRASEFLCDDWAVERGVTAVTLAKCLTQVAEWRLTGHVSPGVAASATSLTDRVEQLLASQRRIDHWRTGWRRRATTLMAIGAIALLTCIGPRTMWESPQAAAASLAAITPSAGEPVVEPEVPRDNNESPLTRTEDSFALSDPVDGPSLDEQLQVVTDDLNHALTRLEAQENDPQITQVIEQLRQRIAAVKQRLNAATSHERLDTPFQD